jgi:hypothetical protein
MPRKTIKKKLRGLSPQANYTDRATAAVGEVVPTFAGRGCCVVSAQKNNNFINLSSSQTFRSYFPKIILLVSLFNYNFSDASNGTIAVHK